MPKITAYQVVKLKEMNESCSAEFAAIKKLQAEGKYVPQKRVIKLQRALKDAARLAEACEKAVARGEISNDVLLTPSTETVQ